MNNETIMARYIDCMEREIYTANCEYSGKNISFNNTKLYSYNTVIVEFIPALKKYLYFAISSGPTSTKHNYIFRSMVKDKDIITINTKNKSLNYTDLSIVNDSKMCADDILYLIKENMDMPINKRCKIWQNLKKDIKFLVREYV